MWGRAGSTTDRGAHHHNLIVTSRRHLV